MRSSKSSRGRRLKYSKFTRKSYSLDSDALTYGIIGTTAAIAIGLGIYVYNAKDTTTPTPAITASEEQTPPKEETAEAKKERETKEAAEAAETNRKAEEEKRRLEEQQTAQASLAKKLREDLIKLQNQIKQKQSNLDVLLYKKNFYPGSSTNIDSEIENTQKELKNLEAQLKQLAPPKTVSTPVIPSGVAPPKTASLSLPPPGAVLPGTATQSVIPSTSAFYFSNGFRNRW